jgi:hypothetical protein
VGIGTPVALLVGMLLVLGSVGLFFFDKIRPAYARDSDKVYAAFILIVGLVTLVNWGMDAGPSFLMFLMSGMLTTLLIENIRNREPLVADSMPPMNKRPSNPRYDSRYDERTPVRRGYRAEIDRDPYRDRPMDLPVRRQAANQSRINPAQDSAWRDDYATNRIADRSADSRSRPRQPYEEYRGPAGQLQPNRAGMPQGYVNNSGYGGSYTDGPGRYGERPPARPNSSRPPERPAENVSDERFAQRPESSESRNEPRIADAADFQSRPTERPPSQRPPERSQGRPDTASDRPANGDRALNVRPYSEAPKLDLPSDSSYRLTESRKESVRPEDEPFDL